MLGKRAHSNSSTENKYKDFLQNKDGDLNNEFEGES
jgi:hypothetical protein